MERQIFITPAPGEEARVVIVTILEDENDVLAFQLDLIDDRRLLSSVIEHWMNGGATKEDIERENEEWWG